MKPTIFVVKILAIFAYPDTFILLVLIEFETERFPLTVRLAVGIEVPTPTRLLVETNRFVVASTFPDASSITTEPAAPVGVEPGGPAGP